MTLIRTLKDLPVEGRRVLLRVDLDSALDDEGTILDDSVVNGLLPTIQELKRREARIIMASGMGKPKGKREARWSIEPIAVRLAELLDAKEDEVVFSEEPVGDGPRHQAHSLKEGHLLILENLRFHSGELANDDSFSRSLASLGEVFINDGFASMNRAQASTVGVTRYLRERGIGLQVEKELAGLRRVTEKPQRPLTAIIGGQKLTDLGELLLALVPQVDVLCVGGNMAMALLWVRGVRPGKEAPDAESLSMAEKILRRVDKREALKLVIPSDFTGVPASGAEAQPASYAAEGFPSDMRAVDIGEKTVGLFRGAVEQSKTLFWCGSLGVGTDESFDRATALIGKAIARSDAYSVVGGPDSLAAIRKAGVAPFIHHLSGGGESSLSFIQGKSLPGLTALMD